MPRKRKGGKAKAKKAQKAKRRRDDGLLDGAVAAPGPPEPAPHAGDGTTPDGAAPADGNRHDPPAVGRTTAAPSSPDPTPTAAPTPSEAPDPFPAGPEAPAPEAPAPARSASEGPATVAPAAPAGAVVARIDELRARVATLLAIADGRAAPGAASGLQPGHEPAPASASPRDDAPSGWSAPDPVDPLTRPVEPIPAAIAAALTGRPSGDAAPGHAPTPGVADPPGGPTTTAAAADHGPSPGRGAEHGEEPAARRPGHVPPPAARPADHGSAPAAHGAPPAAPRPPGDAPRASSSAILVARELLAGGMAPEGVRTRLRDAYGVADPDAALASAR